MYPIPASPDSHWCFPCGLAWCDMPLLLANIIHSSFNGSECCRYKRHLPNCPFFLSFRAQAAMWWPQGMDYDWFKVCMINWSSLISPKVDVWSSTGKGNVRERVRGGIMGKQYSPWYSGDLRGERTLEFPSLSFLFWLLFNVDPKLGILADLLQSWEVKCEDGREAGWKTWVLEGTVEPLEHHQETPSLDILLRVLHMSYALR